MGAVDPREDSSTPSTAAETPEQRQAKIDSHWAYQPLTTANLPKVPKTKLGDHCDPIDAFIYSKLEAKGLQPNKSSNRRILVRRLYYDLLGIRLLKPKSLRSKRIPVPIGTNRWSTACWNRHTSANGWPGAGWT